jgi:type IV pilus assembly protein PilW
MLISLRAPFRRSGRRVRLRQRGLSIVELLVGVLVGLFVVGGAIKLTIDGLVTNRRMLLETRLNQDMRAAADIVARDLRRASYWDNSLTGLWSAGATSVSAVNPYASITSVTTGNPEIGYSYQRPDVDPADSPLGFRLVADGNGVGAIEIRDASNGWQVITDQASLDVTAFTITPTVRTIELWPYCACRTRVPVSAACQDATLQASASRPRMNLRQFDIVIQARSTADASVQRELRETVRVRNDELLNPNGCPAA